MTLVKSDKSQKSKSKMLYELRVIQEYKIGRHWSCKRYSCVFCDFKKTLISRHICYETMLRSYIDKNFEDIKRRMYDLVDFDIESTIPKTIDYIVAKITNSYVPIIKLNYLKMYAMMSGSGASKNQWLKNPNRLNILNNDILFLIWTFLNDYEENPRKSFASNVNDRLSFGNYDVIKCLRSFRFGQIIRIFDDDDDELDPGHFLDTDTDLEESEPEPDYSRSLSIESNELYRGYSYSYFYSAYHEYDDECYEMSDDPYFSIIGHAEFNKVQKYEKRSKSSSNRQKYKSRPIARNQQRSDVILLSSC